MLVHLHRLTFNTLVHYRYVCTTCSFRSSTVLLREVEKPAQRPQHAPVTLLAHCSTIILQRQFFYKKWGSFLPSNTQFTRFDMHSTFPLLDPIVPLPARYVPPLKYYWLQKEKVESHPGRNNLVFHASWQTRMNMSVSLSPTKNVHLTVDHRMDNR